MPLCAALEGLVQVPLRLGVPVSEEWRSAGASLLQMERVPLIPAHGALEIWIEVLELTLPHPFAAGTV